MNEENTSVPRQKVKVVHRGGFAGGVYGLGFIGAAVYYIGHAASFWGGVLGFLKAIVWPAFVIHKLMVFLGM